MVGPRGRAASSELNAPVSRSLRLLFGGTAASVGLAIALGLVIAREIAQRRRMEALESAAALAGQRKTRGARDRCGRTRYLALGSAANEFSGCSRFCALLGLPGARSGETRWSADRIFALVEPSHRVCAGLVRRRLPRERQIKQRRVSDSVRRPRGILVARGGEGRRAAPTGVM